MWGRSRCAGVPGLLGPTAAASLRSGPPESLDPPECPCPCTSRCRSPPSAPGADAAGACGGPGAHRTPPAVSEPLSRRRPGPHLFGPAPRPGAGASPGPRVSRCPGRRGPAALGAAAAGRHLLPRHCRKAPAGALDGRRRRHGNCWVPLRARREPVITCLIN